MPQYLGIDTSNYTTSVAVYDLDRDRVFSIRRLLPVPDGQKGLRQSEALFAHIKQLPEVIGELFSMEQFSITAICASAFPRRMEGSYMPVFLCGDSAARSMAKAFGVPEYSCSHQEGHIVSALHAAGSMRLFDSEFYAFHVSGGTTECLLVRPERNLFSVIPLAKSLDLNAGQLIDRIGVLLGLPFPCGIHLDKLSLSCEEAVKAVPAFSGIDCHFSGAQNQCEKLFHEGKSSAYIARYCIEYVHAAVDGMTEKIIETYGRKPVLYAGGVMSNKIIQDSLRKKYDGIFAPPEFSSDNASGAAIIAALFDRR